MFRFSCPRCNRPFDVPTESAGKKFDCTCGQRLQIPPAPAPPPNKTVLGKVEDGNVPIVSQAVEEVVPVEVIEAEPKKRSRPRFECPYCHTHEEPEYDREMTLVGWILIIPAVLSCVGLIIWLCMMDQMKETVQRCYRCGMRISKKEAW